MKYYDSRFTRHDGRFNQSAKNPGEKGSEEKRRMCVQKMAIDMQQKKSEFFSRAETMKDGRMLEERL